MLSAIYAGVLALIIVWLSLNVIKIRRRKKVRLGDGGDAELQAAIRAQANAAEYVPLAIALLLLLEMSGGHLVLLHAAGLALVAGRLFHARALLADDIGLRVLGMKLTLFTLIGLAVACIGYGAYGRLLA